MLHRRQGEALHPAREPLATLAHIRRTIGEYKVAGQYQQSPAPLGGGLVKAEWFKHYGETERSERFERIVQSWDTANEATELSDFSVCTTWGVRGKVLFLVGDHIGGSLLASGSARHVLSPGQFIADRERSALAVRR